MSATHPAILDGDIRVETASQNDRKTTHSQLSVAFDRTQRNQSNLHAHDIVFLEDNAGSDLTNTYTAQPGTRSGPSKSGNRGGESLSRQCQRCRQRQRPNTKENLAVSAEASMQKGGMVLVGCPKGCDPPPGRGCLRLLMGDRMSSVPDEKSSAVVNSYSRCL